MYRKNRWYKGPKEIKLCSANGHGSSHKLLTGYEAALVCGVDHDEWWEMVKQNHVPQPSFWLEGRPRWGRDIIYAWIADGMPPADRWNRR